MFSWIFINIISATDCSFETAFEKGAQDVELGSFGANTDRFCSFASDEARASFPKSYELGRQYGQTLKKADILATPKSADELDKLLREAKISMATKEILERLSNVPKTPSTDQEQIKNLTKRIETLESENKRLNEQVHRVPAP